MAKLEFQKKFIATQEESNNKTKALKRLVFIINDWTRIFFSHKICRAVIQEK